MIPKIHDKGVSGFSAIIQSLEQIPYQGIHPAETVVIISYHFPSIRGINAHIRHGSHFASGLRVARQSIDLSQPGIMRIRIIDTQKKRGFIRTHERFGVTRVIREVFSLKISTGNLVDIKGKGLSGVDMQLTYEPGSVARRFQLTWQVGRILSIEAKIPGRQTNLTMLVRIKTGQKTSTALTATCLRHISAIELKSLRCQSIQIWCSCISIAITTQFRAVIFGDNKQDIGNLGTLQKECHMEEPQEKEARSSRD